MCVMQKSMTKTGAFSRGSKKRFCCAIDLNVKIFRSQTDSEIRGIRFHERTLERGRDGFADCAGHLIRESARACRLTASMYVYWGFMIPF